MKLFVLFFQLVSLVWMIYAIVMIRKYNKQTKKFNEQTERLIRDMNRDDVGI